MLLFLFNWLLFLGWLGFSKQNYYYYSHFYGDYTGQHALAGTHS